MIEITRNLLRVDFRLIRNVGDQGTIKSLLQAFTILTRIVKLSCNGIGYKGRTGIYEVIAIDEKMRNMIHDGASEHELEAHARDKTPGIREEGMRQVLTGITSLEEVLRVTRED